MFFVQLTLFFLCDKIIIQIFFFNQFDKNNETNDFTFYKQFPGNLIEQNEYETYLLNISKAILGSNNKNHLIETLISENSPLFLRNIILIFFQYTRI